MCYIRIFELCDRLLLNNKIERKRCKRCPASFLQRDVYKRQMPAHATANPAIQQMYINGHFCYAYKFGIVTNGPVSYTHLDVYKRQS